MYLLSDAQFIKKYFCEGSKPPRKTLHKWINEGWIPGHQIGGKVFVDEDEFLGLLAKRETTRATGELRAKNPLID